MATTQKRKLKKGISYTVQVRRRRMKPVSATFRRRQDAVAWAAEIEGSIDGGRYRDPRLLAGVTIGELIDKFLARGYAMRKKATTMEREERTAASIKRHMGEHTTISEIRSEQIAAFRDARMQKVTAYTVRLEMAMLSKMFAVAPAEWGVPIINPVISIERPPAPHGRIRYLTRGEAKILLDCCGQVRNKMLYPYILTLLHTAMRPSEAAGLGPGSGGYY